MIWDAIARHHRLLAHGDFALLLLIILHPVLEPLDVDLLLLQESAKMNGILAEIELGLAQLNLLIELLQISFVIVHFDSNYVVCITYFI